MSNWQVLAFLLVAAVEANAASFQCNFGSVRCIKSQGTEIPSKQAIEILDRCGEFITDDLGLMVIRMSQKEIQDRSGGRLTPLVRAWHAYGDLIESPLKFERKARAEETRYLEVKRACLQLNNDFNDDSKWTK